MKSLRRMLMLAGALSRRSPPARPAAADNKVVIGDIDDMSGPYADVIGAAGVESIKMAIADFGGSVLGQPIEILTFDHQNKPDSRRAETPRMGRHRRHDDAARRLQHRRQPGHVRRGQGEEDPLLRHRRGRRLADRQGLHALYDPLRLRHDRALQRHRQDDPRRGRQELVLPHRRLRLRQATGGGSHARSSRRAAEPWSATCGCRSARRTSPPISSRRKARARRCSGSPTPARTRRTR